MALATILRGAAVALGALALAQPVQHEHLYNPSVVYALDASHSVSSAFMDSAIKTIRAANQERKPAQARYVVFAQQAQLVDSLEEASRLVLSESADPAVLGSVQNRSATNLQQALDVARFGFAPNRPKRLVLITDGNQTTGDFWLAVPHLAAQNIRVFTIAAPGAIERDARVESWNVATGVREQEPSAITARIFSLSNIPARVEVSISNDLVATQTVSLHSGDNAVVLPVQFKQSGLNAIAIRVTAEGDQLPANDTYTDTIWVGAKPKVLYVEGAPEQAHYLRDSLRAQGMEVTTADAERFSLKLTDQDVVILSDVPAKKIDAKAAQRLEAFVRNGGGLLFAAGENTYGDKGYSKSLVETMLPVEFEGPRKRRELDLVMLIDRSHSMNGEKLDFAKAAALATLDLFGEQHRLAIVSFDATLEDTLPLHEVGNKRRAEDLIEGMFAAGQTNIFNAIWYAHRLLENSPAKTKHILLLSDGQSAKPGEFKTDVVSARAIQFLGELRRQRGEPEQPVPGNDAAAVTQGVSDTNALLTEAGITLSTVTIGDEPNLEVMTGLAKGTGGRSYIAQNDAEIPSLFVSETKRLMGEAIVERSFRPIVKLDTGVLAGIDFAKGPELKGFVIGRPKEFAEVLLEAKDQNPLLVQTHYGLGKTVAFLSDTKNRWAADWLRWPGYGKLWAQLVRGSIRRDTGEEMDLHVTRKGSTAMATLTAVGNDGRYRNKLGPMLRMTEPGKEAVLTALRQTAPGVYHTSLQLQAPHATAYRFELADSEGLTQQDIARVGVRSLSYAYPDEYRVTAPDFALLKALSAQTGGKFAPTTQDIFANYGDEGRVSKPWWRLLAAAALVAFLLDLLLRRMPRLGGR